MTYQVTARNFSDAHENRIHSDDVARKLGFEGALVPGVAVFGHLTHPIVERFGADWLGHSQNSTRFFKPAYHGDRLTVVLEEHDGEVVTTCHNDRGVLLAELRATLPEQLAEPENPAILDAPVRTADRAEMTWDTVTEGQPFRPWRIELDAAGNRQHCDQIADDLRHYDTLVHPHWLLSLANRVLTAEYVMPAWIHVGSDIRFRQPLRVGDEIAVRSVPLEKWRRKGHEFVRAYVAYFRDDVLTTEIHHTAIFRIAGV